MGVLKIPAETVRGLKKPGYITRPILCTSIGLCVCFVCWSFCRRAQ